MSNVKVYLSEPAQGPEWVDDLGPLPLPQTTTARPRRRGLRNWQKFFLCYLPVVAGGTWWMYGYAGLATALMALAIWLATMLVIFTLAGRAGRL